MVGEIVVTRVQVPVQKTQMFWEASKKVDALLKEIPGYVGLSVWGDAKDGESFLLVIESLNERTADEAFQALAASELMAEMSDPTEGNVVNRWIRVIEVDGIPISQMPVDSYLSGSRRIAEPGRAEDLAADYQMVFSSLKLLPGYIGSAYGPVSNVPEHFIGLVWWSSKDAFDQSVPRKDEYDLHLFRRVHGSEMDSKPIDFSTTATE